MQIQLKQTEIIAALKQFISAQGINLSGKDVSISFTAGRKEAGIIADVTIEEVQIPGFTNADVEEAIKADDAPMLKVVPTAAAPAPEKKADVTASAEVAEPDEGSAGVAKTTSLFN